MAGVRPRVWKGGASCWRCKGLGSGTGRKHASCAARRKAQPRDEENGGGVSTNNLSEVVIVGAGIAGLACARELQRCDVPFDLIEAQCSVGGRVQTDDVDGFHLDRGFQIFLTSYPEAQRLLDYEDLNLMPFYAGAKVRLRGEFHRVADPLRHPIDGLASLGNPIGTVLDKARVGAYRFQALLKDRDAILQSRDEESIGAYLVRLGFSDGMIETFFRPFFGGIFFDRGLGTSSRLFEFVMKMLASGANCIPASGMGAIPKQLAKPLPDGSIHLSTKAVEVVAHHRDEDGGGFDGFTIKTENGDGGEGRFQTRNLVVATEGPTAWKLLGEKLGPAQREKKPVGTICLYFRCDAALLEDREPILYLNGDDTGIVNNCCFLSHVSPSYAPQGQTLISVSVVGKDCDVHADDEQLVRAVKQELAEWFGDQVTAAWAFIRMYRIPYAQPNQVPPTDFFKDVKLGPGLYVCGDHRDSATLDGAMRSGTRTAQALCRDGKHFTGVASPEGG